MDDRISAVIQGRPRLGALLVIVMMTAWFTISNHCVLGSLVTAHAQSSAVAPMHCHGDRPDPSKNGDEQTPCCKILRAIAVAKVDAGISQLDFVLREYPTSGLIVETWQAHTHTLELDTGPPKAVSFSESVLQRSIPAHAPPFLLS